MVKLKNFSLQRLGDIYNKLLEADFETTKQSLDHIKKTDLVWSAHTITDKARQSIVKKYKLDGKNKEDKEANIKANEEYIKVLNEEIELDLTPFSTTTIESVSLKPIEILLLKELGLYKEQEETQ